MEQASLEKLRSVVRTHPAIDNHAHNLLKHAHLESQNFLSITSEAQGNALTDSEFALANSCARRELQKLYEGKDERSSWEYILEARRSWLSRPADLYRKCFHGTHMILMDDGLDADAVYSFDWHDQWTTGKTKRIVRIEAVAEQIMHEHIAPQVRQLRVQEPENVNPDLFQGHLERFTDAFRTKISEAIESEDVVGFKSVICYRSGLNVDLNNDPVSGDILRPFASWASNSSRTTNTKCRLNSKPLNDWILLLTLSMLSDSEDPKGKKPIQFHTGLGDNDINLILSNPACLQPLISQYPLVPIVLLHSSYPYTREAGYLATVYENVFLDLGLVFPMVSKTGQYGILKQAMELTPTSKLLYSSDGHWFAETYYLALTQFRGALETILVQAVEDGALQISEAIDAAKAILFNNSNSLYGLDLNTQNIVDETPNVPQSTGNAVVPMFETEAIVTSKDSHLAPWENLLTLHPELSFVYVQWFDYMGTMRARVLPTEQFRRLIQQETKLGISTGNIGTLQNDFITAIVDTTGVMYVVPDLTSLKLTQRLDPLNKPGVNGQQRSSASVMSSWCDETGLGLKACPRSRLATTLDALRNQYAIEVSLGFEIELTILRKTPGGQPDEPLTTTHAWSTLSTQQWENLGVLRDIYDGLGECGIHLRQFHAESGPGQYELILPPEPALKAIDTLLQARQIIKQIAATQGLRATLHPGFGNGEHVHISLAQFDDSKPSKTVDIDQSHRQRKIATNQEWSFFAGVLEHLRAICALTLPQEASYSRVVDDHWAGGRWVAWGTQNRETPLRRVEPAHWEFRALDGLSNVYLALGAVLGAGLLGLNHGLEMTMPDCMDNPSRLSRWERINGEITRKLPASISESIDALDKDPQLREVMGKLLVNNYMVMKTAETRMLAEMSEDVRLEWLIERY